MALAAADFTFPRNNMEHRFDSLAGKWLGETTYAFSCRLGINLDPEARFKVEARPVYSKVADSENYQFFLCGSAPERAQREKDSHFRADFRKVLHGLDNPP